MPDPSLDRTDDVTRRTSLANERTWLAWVRTALAATAVAVAVGKVVPHIAGVESRWPYVTIGTGYAVLGVVLIVYGAVRRRDVDRALAAGRYAAPATAAVMAIAGVAAGLAVATVLLLVAG